VTGLENKKFICDEHLPHLAYYETRVLQELAVWTTFEGVIALEGNFNQIRWNIPPPVCL
jgi:hypothetical protein